MEGIEMLRRELLKTGFFATGLALVGGVRMAFASPISESSDWWRGRAIRWLQANLRETDAAIDPIQFVDELEALHVNTALVNAGGITAYYPTDIEFAHVSEYLPEGGDLFGEILREAHKPRVSRIHGGLRTSCVGKDHRSDAAKAPIGGACHFRATHAERI